MPDVVLTVIEADGTEWDPVRIRELYDLGEYEDVEHLFKPKFTQQREQQNAMDFARAQTDANVVKLQAQVDLLTQMLVAKQAPEPKRQPEKEPA
jgi:hypothetical protein